MDVHASYFTFNYISNLLFKYLHSYFIYKIFTGISTDQKYNISVTGGQKRIFSRSNTKLWATEAR